jgi:hypothetical protein
MGKVERANARNLQQDFSLTAGSSCFDGHFAEAGDWGEAGLRPAARPAGEPIRRAPTLAMRFPVGRIPSEKSGP